MREGTILIGRQLPTPDPCHRPLLPQPTQQQQAAAPALPARTHTLPRNAGPGQAAASVGIDPAAMQRLMGLGFPEEQVKKALTISHNNIEMAANILCQFGAGSNAFDDPPRAR